MRRSSIALAVLLASIAAGSGRAAVAAPLRVTSAAPSFRSADGLTVTGVQQLDPRLYALTVTTAAIPGAVLHVRVLVPSGYASHPHARYPVLYLLHGTSGTAADWTTQGDAETATAGLPLIVVMPDIAIDDGGGGWCSNWPDGAQQWETFHIDQLLPWAQANLRTRPGRAERAIAGLSQGGFCSLSYAAQYPDLFGEALSFSGAPDIAYDTIPHLGALAIIEGTELGIDHRPAGTFFGNPGADYLNWADHDPATLAANLRHTPLYLYFGNGRDGPFDTGANVGAQFIESVVNVDNRAFDRRLQGLGITPAVYDAYGNGTHSWPYWNRDLTEGIGPLMADFTADAPPPAAFSFQSAAATYTQYGWTVAMHRAVAEFSTLDVAGPSGFTLAGSGSATVTTPGSDDHRGRYTVTIATSAHATTTQTLAATADGALTITVPLGPSNTIQEYARGGNPQTGSPGTTVDTSTVSIRRAR